MDSVSTNHDATEDLSSEPLPVVPERMNWFHTWDDRTEVVSLYLDRSHRDGCLVLAARRHLPEENACTLYWSGDQLKGIVWRGTAAYRPRAWRDLQRERVQRFLAGD